ncbi:MAG: TadE/TadG family type IV pilus assembly protein [Planctomycetota bacterium]|jgi:Flp pilus assembly protein TadG
MKGQRRGLSALEMAIIFPLLLVMVAGIIEYGWLFLQTQQVTNAARQGARIGARRDASNTDVDLAILQSMTDGGLAGSGYTYTITPADVQALDGGDVFTVEVIVPYGNIELGMPLIPTPQNVRSSFSMAKEGA